MRVVWSNSSYLDASTSVVAELLVPGSKYSRKNGSDNSEGTHLDGRLEELSRRRLMSFVDSVNRLLYRHSLRESTRMLPSFVYPLNFGRSEQKALLL